MTHDHHRFRFRRAAGPIGAITLLAIATPAAAQGRGHFEPTDLALQSAGTLEVDAQVGFTEGDTAGRAIVPDLEVSLGLFPGVQLQIDTAYAVEGQPAARFSFDHPSPDNVWLSSKLELARWDDDTHARAWALGTQLGPKVPLAPGSRGAGYEGVMLLGRDIGDWHLVGSLGGFVDPSADGTRRRQIAIEGGVDLDLDLDHTDHWSLLAEFGTVAFRSADPHQAHATAGFMYSPTKNLDVTLIGLVGLFRAGDRGAVLLGVTPRLALWN